MTTQERSQGVPHELSNDTLPLNLPQMSDQVPQCIGLSPVDAKNTSLDHLILHPTKPDTPVLVSTEALYWYNETVVSALAKGKKAYLFTHTPVDEGVVHVIEDVTERGDIVLVNYDGSDNDKSKDLLESLRTISSVVALDIQGVYQNQYVGLVDVDGCEGYSDTHSFIEAFNQSPEMWPTPGQLEYPLLLASIEDGAEIERLWEIYRSRFEDVEVNSVTEAAFDETSFKEILKDPSVVKAVHVQNSKIVNLMLFMTDISHASWLNQDYFKAHFSEAYKSKNLLLFLGVVSDPQATGTIHSLSPIKLLMKVGQKRSSDAVITFECNEVSAHYLPKLVTFAINRSGYGHVEGLDEPVAQSRFLAISKLNT